MTDSSVRTRRPKTATRAIILAKAAEMYLDGDLAPGDERLSLVLDRLGYTTGAGYQIWANQAAFREELAIYLVENAEHARLGLDHNRAAEVSDLIVGTWDRARYMLAKVIADDWTDPSLPTLLRFYAMGTRLGPIITNSIKDRHRSTEYQLGFLVDALLQKHGRQYRPNSDSDMVGRALLRILDGDTLSRIAGVGVDRYESDYGVGFLVSALAADLAAVIEIRTEPAGAKQL